MGSPVVFARESCGRGTPSMGISSIMAWTLLAQYVSAPRRLTSYEPSSAGFLAPRRWSRPPTRRRCSYKGGSQRTNWRLTQASRLTSYRKSPLPVLGSRSRFVNTKFCRSSVRTSWPQRTTNGNVTGRLVLRHSLRYEGHLRLHHASLFPPAQQPSRLG